MNRIIYMNENYKLLKSQNNIVEGGLARNIAIMNWMQNNIKDLNDLRLSNNAVINIIIVFYILFFKRKSFIVFQYTTVGVPLFNGTLVGRAISNLFLQLLKLSSKSNDIIFDVSDLKYEQSIDLVIEKEKINRMKEFENKFFKLKVKYIFASFSMQDYACDKYGIPIENTEVLINGGNIPHKKTSNMLDIDLRKINYVYAGTLNKGRKIEEMINLFPNHEDIHLYLMGSQGQWVLDVIQGKNITYLGEYPEEEAHQIVLMCDCGLIPYDDNKKYFNISYPTKLSFYITAGIPFISTPVNEVLKINKEYNIGFIDDFNNWPYYFNNLDKQKLLIEKGKISNIKNYFVWENIIKKSKFLSNLNIKNRID